MWRFPYNSTLIFFERIIVNYLSKRCVQHGQSKNRYCCQKCCKFCEVIVAAITCKNLSVTKLFFLFLSFRSWGIECYPVDTFVHLIINDMFDEIHTLLLNLAIIADFLVHFSTIPQIITGVLIAKVYTFSFLFSFWIDLISHDNLVWLFAAISASWIQHTRLWVYWIMCHTYPCLLLWRAIIVG